MSTTSTTTTTPGMILPTQKGYLSGAGNPRDSAIQQMTNTNTKQANLSAAVGGCNYKRKKYGGAVTIPQVSVMYQPQGGKGTDPNSQIATNLKTSTQSTANAKYDNQATVMAPPSNGGGRRKQNTKKRHGGNPNWYWGCFSGGKKARKTRKSRKSRKSRKNN
jgi:hypothetical protein